jgi:hypothetical protein
MYHTTDFAHCQLLSILFIHIGQMKQTHKSASIQTHSNSKN